MAKVGYARASSASQKLDVQLDALKECDKIFSEKASGVSSKRPKLQECLRYLREGDTLYVTKLDRLARSISHLCKIKDELENENISLVIIDQNIDTSTSSGRLLFNMLGVIGQFETELRAERQKEGIANAIKKGIKLGPKPKINQEQVEEMKTLRDSGLTISELEKKYNLSMRTIYRYLNK